VICYIYIYIVLSVFCFPKEKKNKEEILKIKCVNLVTTCFAQALQRHCMKWSRDLIKFSNTLSYFDAIFLDV